MRGLRLRAENSRHVLKPPPPSVAGLQSALVKLLRDGARRQALLAQRPYGVDQSLLRRVRLEPSLAGVAEASGDGPGPVACTPEVLKRRARPLPDQFPLELRDRGQDIEQKLPHGSRSIEV